MYGLPVPLQSFLVTGPFDCGKEPLNVYLKQHAKQNERRYGARTFVIAGRDNRVVGYYTLAAGDVEHADAPPEITKGSGKYPIPVVLLARLAADRTVQGQGFGKALLKDALRRVLQASESIGVRALLVHAKDDKARQWYRKFDFVESPTDPMHLFLPIQDIPKVP